MLELLILFKGVQKDDEAFFIRFLRRKGADEWNDVKREI